MRIKTKQKCQSDSEHLPVYRALYGDDPEQNAGAIHASNREHALFLRLHMGTIRNRTRGRSTSLIQNTSLFLRLYAETIWNRTRGGSMRPIRNNSLSWGLNTQHSTHKHCDSMTDPAQRAESVKISSEILTINHCYSCRKGILNI